MALTRKMLAAMDIPAEKIEEIINAHTETVNAIKEERDALKTENESLKDAEKDLAKANAKIKEFEDGDWENKYNTIKGEYDSFKQDTETKATKAKKTAAYKKLLEEAGVSSKRLDTVLKVSGETIDSIEFDDDGKVKDVEKLTETVKADWSDFIVTKREEGANPPTPPTGDGDVDAKKPSRAAQLAAKFQSEHYGNKEED